jgi:hypothetical protein
LTVGWLYFRGLSSCLAITCLVNGYKIAESLGAWETSVPKDVTVLRSSLGRGQLSKNVAVQQGRSARGIKVYVEGDVRSLTLFENFIHEKGHFLSAPQMKILRDADGVRRIVVVIGVSGKLVRVESLYPRILDWVAGVSGVFQIAEATRHNGFAGLYAACQETRRIVARYALISLTSTLAKVCPCDFSGKEAIQTQRSWLDAVSEPLVSIGASFRTRDKR